MTIEILLQKYGYIAILIGTFLEGETVLIAAGFAAHRGYLDLPLVWLFAFIGTFAGDQVYFFIGRYKGTAILAKKPYLRARLAKANFYLEKYQNWLILAFRFFYGLRTATPIAIGMSNVRTKKYIVLNAISGIVWAIAVGSGGYVFGHLLETIFVDIKHYEKQILASMLILGFVLWMIHRIRRKRHGGILNVASDK
jgi:membrane protein DedA with SNARE-associated domain